MTLSSRLACVVAVLCAVLVPAAGWAQQGLTVTGKVTSNAGAPLQGAVVSIEALGVGSLTREDGTYRIVVPAARAAVASVVVNARMFGYKAQSKDARPSAGRLTLDFVLDINPLRLGEVVVTGAGTSISTEKLGVERKALDSLTLRATNESNIVQALSGRLAGVKVTQSSGEAGASSHIQIRGHRSLGGTGQPMFVVDGTPIISTASASSSRNGVLGGGAAPNRAADINPDDIESVEVLSGPSAAAIYGSMAGNGAVLITTKRGRAGRTAYAFRSSYQMDEPGNTMGVQQKYGVGTSGVTPACAGPTAPAGCFLSAGFFSWGAAIAPGTPVFNNWGNMYENGYTLDNSMQMSGGTDRTSFLLSVGDMRQDGYIVGERDAYNRQTVRLNGSHSLTDRLRVAANVSFSQSNGRYTGRGNDVNGIVLGSVRTPPDFDNRNYLSAAGVQRTWRFPNPLPTQFTFNRTFDNPWYALKHGLNTGENYRTFGNVSANYQPLPWLTVDYVLGMDVNADDRVAARPYQSAGVPSPGEVWRSQFNQQVLDHNLTVRTEKTWAKGYVTRALVGQQLNQQKFRQTVNNGQSLIAPEPLKLANTTTYAAGNDGETLARLEAYFVQAQVDLWDQLYLVATARNEGNSTFGIKNNRAWYPQGSASWVFTNYLASLPLVTYGKLRAAYGQSGLPPAAYLLQDFVANVTFNDFNPGSTMLATINGVGGLATLGNKGNPGIRPERIGEFSGGVDLAFWKDRVDLGVTHYETYSNDLILATPLAPSTGYTGVQSNVGRTRNLGWEVTFNARPYTSKNFAFDFGINWSQNRSRVLSLGDTALKSIVFGNSFSGRSLSQSLGQQTGTIRGTDYARCGRGLTTVGANNVGAACAGQPAGALYLDANGFPIQDPTERVIMDPNANWTGGLRLGATVYGVRLSAFVDRRTGGYMQNMTRASMYNYGTHLDTEIRGATKTFGKDMLPGPTVGPGVGKTVTIAEGWFTGLGGIAGPAAYFNEESSFTRLREVSASYTFDNSWVRDRLNVSSIDLKVAARNLKLWTDYSGTDPEANLGGAAAYTLGYEWMNNPSSKSLVFSVGINR